MSLDLPTIIAIAVAVLIVVVLLVVLGVVLGRRRRARQHEEDRHRAAQLREEACKELGLPSQLVPPEEKEAPHAG